MWGITYSRKAQVEESRASISNVTRALAQHAEDTLKEADIVIGGVLERWPRDGGSPEGAQRTHQALRARLSSLPQIDGVYVLDQDGNLILTSQEKLDKELNGRDRAYFLYHRNHADLDPHIDAPILSRSSGRWGFTISRRYNRPDGSFGGVVVANIDMAYLEKFYRTFDIGSAGAIVLVRADGILLYRRPMRDEFAGKNMSGTVLFREYQANPLTGTALIKSSQDGVTRINVYRSVASYPLFVAVAKSEDEVLAGWWRESLLHGGSVALLLVALLFAGNKLITQVSRRSKAEIDALDAQAKAERLNQSLEQLALKDEVTGLPNRRQFDALLKSELEHARDGQTALSIMMLDIDRFKVFSHLYGHTNSDQCLRSIAAAIKTSLRQSPYLAARYGEEQFCVILPNCTQLAAVGFAEKLCEAVRDLAVPHWESDEGVVTVSIGVSCLDPVDANDIGADLIRSADHALNTAQQRGHNQVASFSLPKITSK
ncbi:sensor domain-containing diguanylate cyclase [Herbaspirillum rhizosphaerae]|uniref:sensor domain-containing diguanylate cyclase n=1 Tax=Herbaspirillum rhizosphaerae TaxID=346179 RepID=UPI00067CD27E|nr:diguanylate cyclase [Herbaspirillum rhizosphaerae]